MTNWARRRRARGVRAALAWVACDMKTSWLERFLRQLHSTSGGLHPSTRQIDSSQRLDQRAWASHLGADGGVLGIGVVLLHLHLDVHLRVVHQQETVSVRVARRVPADCWVRQHPKRNFL